MSKMAAWWEPQYLRTRYILKKYFSKHNSDWSSAVQRGFHRETNFKDENVSTEKQGTVPYNYKTTAIHQAKLIWD